jgi:hypothetical protein
VHAEATARLLVRLGGIITGGVLVLAAALEAFRYYVRQNN